MKEQLEILIKNQKFDCRLLQNIIFTFGFFFFLILLLKRNFSTSKFEFLIYFPHSFHITLTILIILPVLFEVLQVA